MSAHELTLELTHEHGKMSTYGTKNIRGEKYT